jgi:hypothetical protein
MWANLIAFNIVWFGLVMLGNLFVPVALLWLAVHLVQSQYKISEMKLVVAVAAIGASIDLALSFAGIFNFSSTNLLPLWLLVLWCCFAATIAHSLSFLSEKPIWQLGVGAIFPPLSYFAGAQLGAVTFGFSTLFTLSILSVIWALLLVVFFGLKSCLIAQGECYAR